MKHSYLILIVSLLFSAPSLSNDKFEVDGSILYYNTDRAKNEQDQEITADDVEYFKKLLNENSDIKTIFLTSWGGDLESSYEIADLIIDYNLNTHAVEICFSGCTTVLLGGTKRTLKRGSKIGFHRSTWDPVYIKEYYESNKESEGWVNVFDFTSWVYEETQKEIYDAFIFLLERDVDPFFAINSIKAESDEGWYPRRKELLKANFLTE